MGEYREQSTEYNYLILEYREQSTKYNYLLLEYREQSTEYNYHAGYLIRMALSPCL